MKKKNNYKEDKITLQEIKMIFGYIKDLFSLTDAVTYVLFRMKHKFNVGDNVTVSSFGSISIFPTHTMWINSSHVKTFLIPHGMHCIVLETKRYSGDNLVRILSPSGIGWASEACFEKRK